MKRLKMVSLHGVKMTRVALADLAGLQSLTSLSITATSIPEGALLELAKLKTLSYLDLRGSSRSAADLDRLRELMPWCKIDAVSPTPRWPEMQVPSEELRNPFDPRHQEQRPPTDKPPPTDK